MRPNLMFHFCSRKRSHDLTCAGPRAIRGGHRFGGSQMKLGLKAVLLAVSVAGLGGSGAAFAADDKPAAAAGSGPLQPPLNASVRDVRDLREAAISTDGKQVAAVFTASTAEGGQSHVWLLGADGRTARQITVSGGDKEPGERTVAWSQDGTNLYFLARRGEAERFYRLPLAGGEAQALTLARTAKGAVQSGWALKAEDAVDAGPKSYEISPDNRWIAMVATDGRRLALVDEEVDISEKSSGEFIVPAKAVTELNRLLTEKGDVEIKFGENQASFALKDEKGAAVLVISKLIEGNYPNYRQVIPGEAKERVPLNREEFVQALRRAEIMTSEKANSVKLAFGKNTLAITANSPEVGEARETMAVNYKGKEMAIAFNPRYLIDALNALTEDEVFFELIDELSPGVLKINGPFLYVVMPMRLS